tara:strand:- start:40 stop:195 length:156 start_codon:yes stop_codon:yes gene_type:complete
MGAQSTRESLRRKHKKAMDENDVDARITKHGKVDNGKRPRPDKYKDRRRRP